MSMYTMQKLRAIAIVAHQKIWANRFKNVPGKWPEKGFDEKGERNWLNCPLAFLFDKLDEESRELMLAAQEKEPAQDILKEAGDTTALAMMIADRSGALASTAVAPKVVCFCGSTRFMEEFQRASLRETLEGNIVLTVGAFIHSDAQLGITPEQKENLDRLHLRKIDLADEILVLNVDGYIGESTRGEIQYARATGKYIRYLEPSNPATA